ncbi:MAG: hypothetical protein GVX96_06275 [Bacteroidetes bacterium]|jgi:gliding motility-associated lipoprotein GldH|nr:hypothetical protein [Bacteroidota bacterium]
MKRIPILVLAVLFIMVLGCDATVYSDRKEIRNEIWTYAEPKSFEFLAPDTQSLYDIYLSVDHSQDFEYQNLYMELQTIYPNSDTVTQPFSIDLSDRFGNWIGDCGSNSCRRMALLQPKTRFEYPGTYQLVINQFSRTDSLPGLKALTVEIEPTTL